VHVAGPDDRLVATAMARGGGYGPTDAIVAFVAEPGARVAVSTVRDLAV